MVRILQYSSLCFASDCSVNRVLATLCLGGSWVDLMYVTSQACWTYQGIWLQSWATGDSQGGQFQERGGREQGLLEDELIEEMVLTEE